MYIELTVFGNDNSETKTLINFKHVVFLCPYKGLTKIETKNEVFLVKESYEFIKTAKKIAMAKKIEIEIDYDEEATCERCEAKGAMDFAGEYLCINCVKQDVFEDYEDKN